MSTLLLHKNRVLRALALVAAVALMFVMSNSDPAAVSAATSIRMRVVATCGAGTYTLKIGGTQVLTASKGNDCTCTPQIIDVTSTSGAALALVGAPGCTDISVVSNGGDQYISYIRVDINRAVAAENEVNCLADSSNGGCQSNSAYLCNGYTGQPAQTFYAGPGDDDNDGINNCVDPDNDNDGVLNTVDNCPTVANTNQADTDGNGKGDACDPYDVDGDGVWNVNDNCPQWPNATQADSNSNGVGDACEDDSNDPDHDGLVNASDNCPTIPNASQADANANGVGDACEKQVVAVPWLGSELLAHQVYPGGTITLQAVASDPVTGAPISLSSGTWDPGDGAGPQAIGVGNSLVLEKTWTYNGAVGQPFTATIRVVDTGGKVYTDTMKVVIAANSRETKVNMAIDLGLWGLHKRITRTTVDGQNAGYWTYGGGWIPPATASAVQAFEINNHRESGDRSKDPYVDDVARGMRTIMSTSLGRLGSANSTLQGANNPDANGNGYYLVVSGNDHSSYITGQVIDAIVASGTPYKKTPNGEASRVAGRTYRDIVQDLLDGYSWGMADNKGGWYYTYQGTSGSNDTSASHWWGIGVLASHTWFLDAPTWVKDIQRTVGVPLMQAYPGDCHFGYTDSTNSIWDDATNVTAAGLILMNANGTPKSSPRFTCAEGYLASRFVNSTGNFYTMYQTTKAMRTARDASGETQAITLLNGTVDWYAGYADYLIGHQDANGTFAADRGSTGVGNGRDDLGNAWAIIMLSPSLFELPPSAACVANPSTIGTHGGVVNFSAAASFHPDPTATITGYTWNFGDASASGSGVTTSHTYAQPASFPTVRNATVTVTDSNGNSATAACPVTIVNTNVPPAVSAGGPYTVCQGSPLILMGTATDEDSASISTVWDITSPVNFAAVDGTGNTLDVTSTVATRAPGTYDVGFRATDSDGASSAAFSTVTVIPANDPSCNQPPVAVNDEATTNVNQAVGVNVVANDTDADGNTLTVTSATNGANGTVSFSGGSVTYTPNTNFSGDDTFTYTIGDGHGGTATATVTIHVLKYGATATATGGTFVYDGASHGGTCSVTGSDGATLTGTISYSSGSAPVNAGSYTVSCAFAGDATHTAATTATATITIDRAPSVTTVTCADATYTGSAIETCTASVSGVGGLGQGLTVTYANNVNAGVETASGSASYAGDANHEASSGSDTFSIGKASSVTVVTCADATYTGSAIETCTASVTGAGGLDQTLTPTYGNNVNAGTATGSASYAGDDNHEASSASTTFEIAKAPSVTVVTCPVSLVYTGLAQTPCTANVTGVGGLDQAVTPVTHANNTNVGTATATATFGGDANHVSSTGNATFEITKANATCTVTPYSVTYDTAAHTATGACVGVRGETLAGLSLTATTHTNAGTYTDAWTFTDVTGNYNNTGGSVVDVIAKAPTKTTLAISSSVAAAGAPVTLTATVVSVLPGAGIPNGTVTFNEGATVLGTATVNASGVATFTTTTLSNGPHTIGATYNESANFLSSTSNTVQTLIYGFATGGGTFVISDTNATMGKMVNFWGSQWEKNNIPTGGASNASFKGYAISPAAPAVGQTFTAAPGNSAPSPSSVPQYLGIIVTSKVTKSGSNITGTIVKLVVVKVEPGYAGNPGNAGNGTIVAFVQ